MKALIVDDDLSLADVVSFTLRRAGYDVIVANDGIMALERWKSETPDFIILDLNLPRLNGLEVCRRIRAESAIPILILSVRDDDDDVVTALRYGADDYVAKPFSPRQLVARVEAVLRRSGVDHPAPDKLKAGDMTLDCLRGEVFVGDKLCWRLTNLENQLLQSLMLNKNQILPSETLIDQVYGPAGGDKSMLKQLVYRLRTKIGTASTRAHIETWPGVGYSLVTDRKSSKR
jgi:DNA-binding response OmpR family regulator